MWIDKIHSHFRPSTLSTSFASKPVSQPTTPPPNAQWPSLSKKWVTALLSIPRPKKNPLGIWLHVQNSLFRSLRYLSIGASDLRVAGKLASTSLCLGATFCVPRNIAGCSNTKFGFPRYLGCCYPTVLL